jgi:hypothetical protein
VKFRKFLGVTERKLPWPGKGTDPEVITAEYLDQKLPRDSKISYKNLQSEPVPNSTSLQCLMTLASRVFYSPNLQAYVKRLPI